MTPLPSRQPELDHCVQILQSLPRDLSSRPPKTIGEVHVAAVGLLYHLKVDQAALQKIRKQNDGKDRIPFPRPKEIPAITAVVHNQILFRTLVSCLSSSTGDSEGESRPHLVPASRKRTHSLSDVPDSVPSKSLKLAHSPQVSKKTFSYSRPQLNLKILAATILYISFEHFDHWPVPLVKAYANDSFGPRSWVDHPACQLLVQNLSLVHDVASTESQGASFQRDARIVAKFYDRSVKSEPSNSSSQSPVRKRNRGSLNLSSIGSQSAMNAPNLGQPRPRSLSLSSNDTHISTKPTKEAAPVAAKSGKESDSGDEEVAVSTKVNKKAEADGSSSSSGEEDEVEVATQSQDVDKGKKTSPLAKDKGRKANFKPTYPVVQQNLKFVRIRQRYFGDNLEAAYSAVHSSLNERLDVKTKQNSGLLQTLPKFTSIPPVRTLITANLEKWLQSPALAGLARSLFSRTVKMMKNLNPPLPADLAAIDNILSMRLKANQLNAHIENVTAIAKNIPSPAVSRHIFSLLMRDILLSMDPADSIVADHLKMIQAVHNVLPHKLSADGIAAALLTLLTRRPKQLGHLVTGQLVQRLRALMRAVAKQLGSAFDGCQLLRSLASFKPNQATWGLQEEENKARLMIQCTILLAGAQRIGDQSQHIQPARAGVPSPADLPSFRKKLFIARKLLLSWCVRDYAPRCTSAKDENGNGAKAVPDPTVGAGPANYSSILDGVGTGNYPPWLEVMRTVLFLEDPDSQLLQRFMSPDGAPLSAETEWKEESFRFSWCCDYGADLTDEMIWIVLKAVNQTNRLISAEVALTLLEHLFSGCKKGKNPVLRVKDSNIIKDMYEIAVYTPPKPTPAKKDTDEKASDVPSQSSKENPEVTTETSDDAIENGESDSKPSIPRLAYPGMWWRVTGLALIMCGSSPDRIGRVAWDEQPTLRSLIKMVTSDKYRFPTVDCDEEARDEMKKTEQAMRDEEARITEVLFLPKKAKVKVKEVASTETSYGGSRASRRQKEKREKLLKKQREKEAAEAAAEASRRKKMLRAAQKSIMLWDPKAAPRKPPRESADLIFTVGDVFELPKIFQQCPEPDFLLKTIGSTSRGAIERAYGWLIPIISIFPDTISRLPASASCFLLLRAYGTEGDERTQLQELSAPLLDHVRNSLLGNFGETDAVRAFDLLLTDVASHNPDRRRCARRVLHDAIGKTKLGEMDAAFAESNCSWMMNMMHVKHVTSILSDSIKHMTRAASFERGRTLRFLVLALDKLSIFAADKNIPGDWYFPRMMIGLMSNRPAVFAATLGAFPDLRKLAMRAVREEFKRYISSKDDSVTSALEGRAVDIRLSVAIPGMSNGQIVPVVLPLSLLQSSCVLLSIWVEEMTSDDSEQGQGDQAVQELVSLLLRPQDGDAGGDIKQTDETDGLASAKIAGTSKSAVPVESWVMLARSRADFIAKRAALTAPTSFLPRLLLCSGLPRASLLTMIDRLGKLGSNVPDKGKIYNQLLIPSAASEWDIGRLGHRREVSRKLLGRLSAYSRMYNLSKLEGDEAISFTFLDWLSEAVKSSEKPKKTKNKRAKLNSATVMAGVRKAESILDAFTGSILGTEKSAPADLLEGDASEMTIFRDKSGEENDEQNETKQPAGEEEVKALLGEMFEDNAMYKLDCWLTDNYSKPTLTKKRKRSNVEAPKRIRHDEVSRLLLESFCAIDRKTAAMGASIVKWVPVLSATSGSPGLWSILFATNMKPKFMWDNLLSRCCQVWTRSHMSACRGWMLSRGSDDALEVERLVAFLIQSSSFGAVHLDFGSNDSQLRAKVDWVRMEEHVVSGTRLALDCMESQLETVTREQYNGRNDLPDSVVLLLLIARSGRKQVQRVCQAIIERMGSTEEGFREALLSVILRLYAYYPHTLNLGVAVLRSALKEAVSEYATDWLVWRSPLDDQFQDMIDATVANGAPARLVQALTDGSKKHPLLLLRKISVMERCLKSDAEVCHQLTANDKRGIIFGYGLNGPMPATVSGKVINVTVKHWGFNFTESVWFSFLDIVSAVPREVLFECGLKMGLLDFLGVYLQLMSVQSQLRTSDRLGKLRTKLSEFFDAFKKSNVNGWDQWLESKTEDLPSLGKIRNVLMSCSFISHEQAVASVKKVRAANDTQPPKLPPNKP